jgi:regulator of replication initiation timing
VDERGQRVFLIEEIQSDMHQKPKQKPDTFKYAQRQDEPEFIKKTYSLDQVKKLKDDLGKVSDQIDKITGHTDPSAVTIMERLKVKREALRDQITKAERTIMDAQDPKKDEIFPEGPWKKSENQVKIAIKTLINLATQEGFDSVAIITGKAKNYAVSADEAIAKGNRGFYDGIAPSAMKNVAKNLGLEFSSTNIKDGKGNTWAKIPIINLKKEPVKASVDMYKAEGGFIYRPSFVDVVPVL